MAEQYSDFIVYVDESGDHSLTSIDVNYPVFVLAFCIFEKNHYLNDVVPQLQKLKFEYFGHDLIVLHEHEIRKEKAPFNIFPNREARQDFIHKLSEIIERSDFKLVSCVIDKKRVIDKSVHPYHLSLKHCLETLYEFICEQNQTDKITFVIVEGRGKKEDEELELEFLRICGGDNKFQKSLPFKIKIVSKQVNSSGLQLADLVARPIGRYILDKTQTNRAFEILRQKFYAVSKNEDPKGLKHFPNP